MEQALEVVLRVNRLLRAPLYNSPKIRGCFKCQRPERDVFSYISAILVPAFSVIDAIPAANT